MKLLKSSVVVVLLVCAAKAGGADESFQGALHRAAPVHPSQYSFADLYRVTVAAGASAAFPAFPQADLPVRVTTAAAPTQFAIAEVNEPQLGLLLLSGMALALWVARRRLGYGFR
jgi:hypothetical protein